MAENVHQTISKMKDLVGNIKKESEDSLNRLSENWGISEWVGSVIKTELLVLFIVIMILIAFGLIRCIWFTA